jgi:hypothetical protein
MVEHLRLELLEAPAGDDADLHLVGEAREQPRHAGIDLRLRHREGVVQIERDDTVTIH